MNIKNHHHSSMAACPRFSLLRLGAAQRLMCAAILVAVIAGLYYLALAA